MAEDDDMQPLLRIDAGNGMAFYPRYHKNAKGDWELNDKSFQKMLMRHSVLEPNVKKEDE
jgi:hypothetical protein